MSEINQIYGPAWRIRDFIGQQLSFATGEFFSRIHRDIDIAVRPVASVEPKTMASNRSGSPERKSSKFAGWEWRGFIE